MYLTNPIKHPLPLLSVFLHTFVSHLCVVLTALFCLLTDGRCCGGRVLLNPHSKGFQLTLMEEKICKFILLLWKLPVSIMKEIIVSLCVGKGMCWQRYELNEIIWNLLYLSSSCRILSSSKRAWIWALSASSSLTCVSSNSWILFFCCCTSFCISVNVAVVFSLAYIISNLINIVSNALTLQCPVLRTNIYIVQMFGVSNNNNNNNNNDVIIFNNIVVVLIKWMQP